ncbi:hypothetical protein DIPPA_12618 [Diplonema papillatum]|nr:hypothetical protein DIPPA_12618 [Diplonema papillatum]
MRGAERRREGASGMPSLYQKIAAVVVVCITLQMSVQHGLSKDAKTPRSGQVYAALGLTSL